MFIALEGIEGAGKSTLQTALNTYLRSTGRDVLLTKEPGATELGRTIRQLLLDRRDFQPHPESELLLFSADRAEHVRGVIQPALERGQIVLCDRYIHSTIAYQGFGRGLSIPAIENIIEFSTMRVRPELVLLLDLEPQLGLKRARSRQDGWNKFEEEELEFHQKVRRGFLELASDKKNKIKVIDASQDIDRIESQAIKYTRELLSTAT